MSRTDVRDPGVRPKGKPHPSDRRLSAVSYSPGLKIEMLVLHTMSRKSGESGMADDRNDTAGAEQPQSPERRNETDNGRDVFTFVGLLADATAISAWSIGGGQALVWSLAVFGMVTGIVMLARRWGRPVGFLVCAAGVVALTGAGILGFAIGQSGSTESTATASTLSTKPSTDSDTTTTTATTPSRSKFSTSDSDTISTTDGPVDIDSDGNDDIRVARTALEGINGAQFATSYHQTSEATLEHCSAPERTWRFTLPPSELHDNRTVCLRTPSGHYGFLTIRNTETQNGDITRIDLLWAIWR